MVAPVERIPAWNSGEKLIFDILAATWLNPHSAQNSTMRPTAKASIFARRSFISAMWLKNRETRSVFADLRRARKGPLICALLRNRPKNSHCDDVMPSAIDEGRATRQSFAYEPSRLESANRALIGGKCTQRNAMQIEMPPRKVEPELHCVATQPLVAVSLLTDPYRQIGRAVHRI